MFKKKIFIKNQITLTVQFYYVLLKVIVLNADLDLEHIGSEYKRYENHIINPTYTQQPQAVLISPSKRPHMG